MKKKLKYIISIGLSGFIVKLFDYIQWDKVFKGENWQWLLETRFNLLHIAGFVIAFIIIMRLLSLVTYKDKKLNKIQDKLKQLNHLDFPNDNVTAQWEVVFDPEYDNDPHPINIKLFCTKHEKDMGMKMLIKNGRCPVCDNEEWYDMEKIEAYIESYLHNEWNKINTI